jgi:plastocyanin
MLWFTPPAKANDPVIVEIKLEQGHFVLVPAEIKITAGQSVKWVPIEKDFDVAHHLAPATSSDAFEETHDFDSSNPPTRTFNTPGVVHYFCKKHPKTMVGTITVTPANQ